MEGYPHEEALLVNKGFGHPENKGFRGEIHQSNKPLPSQVDSSTANGLLEAINAGDSLSNPKTAPGTHVKRRALLVSAQYQYDPRFSSGHGALPSTPNDTWRIYQMLRSRGYEAANIRILTEGIANDDKCAPTKINIMESLKWLVEDTQPGDYRFFHYSGHGGAFETGKLEGKEAPEIPAPGKPVDKDDTELIDKNPGPNADKWKRVESKEVDPKKLKYYNEAFVTSYSTPPSMKNEYEKLSWNLVWDTELNAEFAKLPKGSMLTCAMDCCNSGRLINANFKLLGNGFRGELSGANGGQITESLPTLPDIELSQQNGLTIQDSLILRDDSIDKQSLIVEVPAQTSHAGTTESRSLLALPAAARNFFLPPVMVKLEEKLPAEEANRDKIKANILAWSGCQQRQTSLDSGTAKGGYFTYAFTTAIDESPKDITVGELHQKVDAKLKDMLWNPQTKRFTHLQFTQLWTSLGDGDELQARARLDIPFVV